MTHATLALLLTVIPPAASRAQHGTEGASPVPAPVKAAAPADGPAAEAGAPAPSSHGRKKRGKASHARAAEIDDELQPDAATVVQTDPVRGVHLTGWAAGSPKFRGRIIREVKEAGLNAVVIALKEYDGRVFVKGVPLAREIGAYTNAIPDLPACVADFRQAGIRTIGRIVLFKDNILGRKRPQWAVKTPDGDVWRNEKGIAWVDPYRREVWDYNLAIASAAASAGFDEIQFDYVRFPSDGNTKLCRYSRPDHDRRTAVEDIRKFLVLARETLKPFNVRMSICLFGMTTSAHDDMGIGQRITDLAAEVDVVSPMMYPSHYRKGELGVKNPNREPFKIIRRGIRDAVTRLGSHADKLRPYFQDFSLGVRYDAEKVRAQILAAQRFGITSWILWNPQNRYTWAALRRDNRPVWETAPPAANAIPEGGRDAGGKGPPSPEAQAVPRSPEGARPPVSSHSHNSQEGTVPQGGTTTPPENTKENP